MDPTMMRAGPSQRIERTRLAPSPTGALHLGNARTFLINWALARRNGWRVVLRIEDLDGPRIRPGAGAACIETLAWLGLTWDEGPVYQTADLTPYEEAMRVLACAGTVYACSLTRREIEESASAPQEGSHERPFPPHLRPRVRATEFSDAGTNWRLVVPDCQVCFADGFAGRQVTHPARDIGDFVVWTKRGLPAYQLAVVVDDARQGVTQVVRGDDLLPSTGRQLVLHEALKTGAVPAYTHLPLVRGPDGRRLAKRHGDTRVETYRGLGVAPERVVGLIARWSIPGASGPMSAREFADRFDLSRMGRDSVIFTEEDHRWLIGS